MQILALAGIMMVNVIILSKIMTGQDGGRPWFSIGP